VALLSREERKALILVGPSRTGKTELARFLRLLVGNPIATPSVAEVSERFGLSSLYDATAWVRDDAINEGDDLDPQRFKTIVTGEPIDIERKHRDAIRGVELALPVVLTANALPRARDKSDALFNRSLVLELTNVISEEDAFRFRTELGVPRGQTVASSIFGTEGPGILNWALDGLDRLLERGRYELPEAVRVAVQRFKEDNNPVGEWARTSIVRRSSSKVARSDLLCAFHGWQREQDGDEARALGGRGFFPRLRAAVAGLEDISDASGRRYVGGIALTDEGLQLWDLHNLGPQLKGGSKGVATTKMEVNKAHTGPAGSAAEVQF
jgi:P4 family phage/plasmid primase-like protien